MPPLSLAELEDLQADCLADDIGIQFDKMSLWTKEQVGRKPSSERLC
jgi:hypothetical protein